MTVRTSQIEERLAREAGIHAAAEESGDLIVLTGIIASEEERQAALDIAGEVAEGRRIEDNLSLLETMPDEIGDRELSGVDIGGFSGAMPGLHEEGALEPGDFMEPAGVDASEAAGPSSSIDDDLVSEGNDVYSPPADPVGTDREVIGGFQMSSMDDIAVERSALDGRFGDEAIADAIRRELREDAATTDLDIGVSVREGVVRLRGRVALLEDTDNAIEVALRVPGVVDVEDELEIPEP